MPRGKYKHIIGVNCGLPNQGFQKGNEICQLSKRNKGQKHTKETKEKMKKSQKGKIRNYYSSSRFKKGHKAYEKEEHWNWQNGISFEPYTTDWSKTLRQSIRERDHYICQLCLEIQSDRAHSIHHIDYQKRNCNPDNLITLCVVCNSKVNFNRDHWTNYFKNPFK